LALKNRDPLGAIEILQTTLSREMGIPHSTLPRLFGVLYPVYVRGVALLAANRNHPL